MSVKTVEPGDYTEVSESFEYRTASIPHIEFERAPGGKVIGLKLPAETIVPVTLIDSHHSRTFELKKTKAQPHPSVDWNAHRVTLVSIEPGGSHGYQVQLKTETIPMKKFELGVPITTMTSGDLLEGPGQLTIRHSGYVNAHMMSSDGRASNESSCTILVTHEREAQRIRVSAPLKAPYSVDWKQWTFTFTKTDPDGGTMPTQAPIEFTVTEK